MQVHNGPKEGPVLIPQPHAYFFIWHRVLGRVIKCFACRILVPWLGIKPAIPAVEAGTSPNHWTAGEDPDVIKLKIFRDISGGPVVKNPPSHVGDAS